MTQMMLECCYVGTYEKYYAGLYRVVSTLNDLSLGGRGPDWHLRN